MMGLRKAWTLNAELAAMARLSKREEFNKRLENAKKNGGIEAFSRNAIGRFSPSHSDQNPKPPTELRAVAAARLQDIVRQLYRPSPCEMRLTEL